MKQYRGADIRRVSRVFGVRDACVIPDYKKDVTSAILRDPADYGQTTYATYRRAASGKLLAKTKMDTSSNPLIKAVVDDFATSEGRTTSRDGLKESLGGKKPAEVKTACIEILGKVHGVLSAKAPGDAAAFKNWLRQISQSVAEASTERGFLGIGGVAVSDAEKATLAEISSALKLS